MSQQTTPKTRITKNARTVARSVCIALFACISGCGEQNIKCVAFDCFGTVFDMASVPQSEIAAYARHIRKRNFTPHDFPESWVNLEAHKDSAEGILRLRRMGIEVWALSNGDAEILKEASRRNGIEWDGIVDLASHRVYKPNTGAYRTLEVESGFSPDECLMVTANATFGDIEGAAAIGMRSQVIRHGHPNTIIELAEMLAD